jgi:hypothetical protein
MTWLELLRRAFFFFFTAMFGASAIECYARPDSESPVTVCEIAGWDRSMDGKTVRIKALYSSDFRHGAFLFDEVCPLDHVSLGVSPEEPDRSLLQFDEYIGEHYDYYIGRKFAVDLLGVFRWREQKIVNAELPPDRHLIVKAHGRVSILKVFDFEKPPRPSMP